MASELQRSYQALVTAAARLRGKPFEELLEGVARRSARINRYDRITGDSIEYATSELVRNRQRIGNGRLHWVIDEFVKAQGPDSRRDLDGAGAPAKTPDVDTARRTLDVLIEAMGAYRHNL